MTSSWPFFHDSALLLPNSNGKLQIICRENICKRVLGLPLSTVNGAAEYRLGRDSRTEKTICRIAKFWYGILQMEEEEMLKCCWNWQRGILKQRSWAASLREELYKTGLGYVWQNVKDWDIRVLYQNIINRCNNIEKQTKIQRIRETKSLSAYGEMKKELGREFYTSCY